MSPIVPTDNISLAGVPHFPSIPGAILWCDQSDSLIIPTVVSPSRCQSYILCGNAGKPMPRHAQRFFFQFFLELLRYPNTLATIPSSSKLPTILSAPSNMLPSSCAGLPMVPELDAAGTLVFCPSLEWEADAQEGLYESPFCYKPRALRCIHSICLKYFG